MNENDIMVIEGSQSTLSVLTESVRGVRITPGRGHAERDAWDEEHPPERDEEEPVRSWERPTPATCNVTVILDAGLATIVAYSEEIDGISERAQAVHDQILGYLKTYERGVAIVHEHKLSAAAAKQLGEAAATGLIESLRTGRPAG